MSGLKQLRTRLKSIKSTQKITKAMQLVAASKLKRARAHIIDADHYLELIVGTVQSIASNVDLLESLKEEKVFFDTTDSEKPNLLVLITSERGLCGAFNSTVIKQVKQEIINLERHNQQIKLIIVGKKGYEALKNRYPKYIDSYLNVSKNNAELMQYQLQQKIMNFVRSNAVGNCYLFFNKFQNAMSYKIIKSQLFPIVSGSYQPVDKLAHEYEGDKCISSAINLYVMGQLTYALVHSKASEEGARMTAMDGATKNANKIVNELTLKFNRTRQRIITKELIEIISGAEVV
ncbi:ATP synthase F1 subunit gamma [Candidatus Trichorickettsia mobilis]|uniref:ATP synthase F1 subunit gamma n=1 Tax=Candidatus Trichorickettsia mobilis TaxID=1346319 RepID=UPI002930D6B9|nr:ATP synthase F1 subunit gamma [Candidatus Trichorickettsia mobilis]